MGVKKENNKQENGRPETVADVYADWLDSLPVVDLPRIPYAHEEDVEESQPSRLRKFLRALAAFVKYLAKLAIVVGWYYLVVNLPALNVWLALTVWALVVADFWLWLCHSRYCETPRWFDWFPPGVGFYCWWAMRPPRKRRRS